MLKDICMTADPNYKRSLIRSLENFKTCLQEKKLSASSSSESVDSLKEFDLHEKTAIATSCCLSLSKERRQIGVSYSQVKVSEKKKLHRTWKVRLIILVY